jgi:hypothetical protein
MNCLFPGCTKLGNQARGLCSIHYDRARVLVNHGRTTWEELERKGKSKKPTHENYAKVTKWFLAD